MTPYQKHIEQWRDCRKCLLCDQRKRVVFARGQVPCEVLFIGEAPGASEDVLGKTFCGPAGHLLDRIIEQSQAVRFPYTYALTNLVCCYPRDAKGEGNHEPPEEAIKACAPRLRQFIRLCRPRLIICVGKLASKWINNTVEIIHPAAILRMDVSQRGLAVQRCVVTIADAVAGL